MGRGSMSLMHEAGGNGVQGNRRDKPAWSRENRKQGLTPGVTLATSETLLAGREQLTQPLLMVYTILPSVEI